MEPVPEHSLQSDLESKRSDELQNGSGGDGSSEAAYWLPMLIFLGFTWAGGKWPEYYPASYVAKTILVTLALVMFWRTVTKIRWHASGLGLIVGIAGTAQWIGMQLWLEVNFEFFRPTTESFDPTSYFSSATLFYAFVLTRLAGAVILVPVMEELFWRDYLWRTMIAPSDFRQVAIGSLDRRAIGIVCIAFASVHGHCWLTAIVWSAIIAWLLVRTRSLGACIVAHATTNLLLAIYVLWTKDWSFW